MSKMRKEYDPNKVKRRKRKPIVYIICEGKETETLYFKHFPSRNCLVDIIPIPSKHKAAEHLVKHAKSLISQADYYPKDGCRDFRISGVCLDLFDKYSKTFQKIPSVAFERQLAGLFVHNVFHG